MENTVSYTGDNKSEIIITDKDDNFVSFGSLPKEGVISVVTKRIMILDAKGALALRDYLNQYLVGYE